VDVDVVGAMVAAVAASGVDVAEAIPGVATAGVGVAARGVAVMPGRVGVARLVGRGGAAVGRGTPGVTTT
jgi:hypothetical protein